MTYDELCRTMATRSIKSPEQWSDFFSMPAALQEIEATLMRDAIFEKSGPSGLQVALSILETAVSIAGMVSGVGSALSIFRALP